MGRAPGVVVDGGDGWVFVGAELALGVLDGPRLSPVPNAGFSLLWFEGEVIAAVPFRSCLPFSEGLLPEAVLPEGAVGAPGARMQPREAESPAVRAIGECSQVLVCELAGQRYGLTGVQVLATGEFERVSGDKGDSVRFSGLVVPRCSLAPPAFVDPPSAPASAAGVRGTMSSDGDCGPSGPKDAGTT